MIHLIAKPREMLMLQGKMVSSLGYASCVPLQSVTHWDSKREYILDLFGRVLFIELLVTINLYNLNFYIAFDYFMKTSNNLNQTCHPSPSCYYILDLLCVIMMVFWCFEFGWLHRWRLMCTHLPLPPHQ